MKLRWERCAHNERISQDSLQVEAESFYFWTTHGVLRRAQLGWVSACGGATWAPSPTGKAAGRVLAGMSGSRLRWRQEWPACLTQCTISKSLLMTAVRYITCSGAKYLSISRRLALQGSRSCLSCAQVAEHRGDAIPRSFCCCICASSSHSSTALLPVRWDSPNAVASLSFSAPGILANKGLNICSFALSNSPIMLRAKNMRKLNTFESSLIN